MKRHSFSLLLCVLLFSLDVLFQYGCSREGEGEFNLDEIHGRDKSQTLSVTVEGDIAGLELNLPFNPSKTIPSSISVEPLDVPEDTHVDYSVKEEEGVVKVVIMNGRKNGFSGEGLKLKLHYIILGKDPSMRLFERQVEKIKVLDTNFKNKQDKVICRWTEG